MGMEFTSSAATARRVVNPRILVQMPVQATWTDASGEIVSVKGMTENVGTNSVLVNFDNLPPVGGEVHLRMMDDSDTPLLEADARVIRVERDPSKPLAAMNVLDNVDEWQERVWTTAQEVAARTYASDEDEWIN